MHPNDTSPPQLRDLATAYGARGTIALGSIRDCAVLLHCGDVAPGNDLPFETVIAVTPWSTRVAFAAADRGHQANPELLVRAGAVFTVAKRPGGPFPDRIGVGRARTADICLRLSSISKYHAYFTQERDGEQLTVWDARGRNGTYVNGQRLPESQGTALNNGETVTFGDEQFLFFSWSGFLALLDILREVQLPSQEEA